MKSGRLDPFKELSTSEIRMLLKHLEAPAKKKKTHKKKPHKKKPHKKKPHKPKKSDSRKRKRTKKAKMLKYLDSSKWAPGGLSEMVMGTPSHLEFEMEEMNPNLMDLSDPSAIQVPSYNSRMKQQKELEGFDMISGGESRKKIRREIARQENVEIDKAEMNIQQDNVSPGEDFVMVNTPPAEDFDDPEHFNPGKTDPNPAPINSTATAGWV